MMAARFVLVLLLSPFAILYLWTSMLIVGRDEANAEADRIGQRWARYVGLGRTRARDAEEA